VSTKARVLTIVFILLLAFSSLGAVSFATGKAADISTDRLTALVEGVSLNSSVFPVTARTYPIAEVIAGQCTATSGSSCGQ
jgi:hypothetical protein